jgi:hypothetical protein
MIRNDTTRAAMSHSSIDFPEVIPEPGRDHDVQLGTAREDYGVAEHVGLVPLDIDDGVAPEVYACRNGKADRS